MLGIVITIVVLNVLFGLIVFLITGVITDYTANDAQIGYALGSIMFVGGMLLYSFSDEMRNLAFATTQQESNSILRWSAMFWMVLGLGIVLNIYSTIGELGKRMRLRATTNQ